MKKLLLFTILFYSTIGFAQQKSDSIYSRVFGDFVRYYNTIKPDSMAQLFNFGGDYYTKDLLEKEHTEWGKIVGFKYIGAFKDERDVEGNTMVYFKVSFHQKANLKSDDTDVIRAFNGKDIHAAAIALNNDNLIVGRRLFTSSKDVDSLIAQY